MGLREIGWEIVDWIHMVQEMVQWLASCEHGNELPVSEKAMYFFTS
jgi:hypothetical protein